MMEELAIIQTDVLLILQSLSDLVDQSFGIFPSQTWVGDGFAVAVFSDLLAAWFDIAFYHDTFDHLVDLAGMAAAVEYFLDNTDLLHVLFAGVGVVGIHDAGRICQIPFGVKLMKEDQIFIVVVRNILAMLVDCATQNGVGQWIARCVYFITSENEFVTALCCHNRV